MNAWNKKYIDITAMRVLMFNRYTLQNKDVKVQITNLGGIITNIFTPDKNGQLADITLGYDSLNGKYLTHDTTSEIQILAAFYSSILSLRCFIFRYLL